MTFESAVQTQLVLYNQNIHYIDQPAWQVRRYLIILESRNLLLMIELSVQQLLKTWYPISTLVYIFPKILKIINVISTRIVFAF